MQTSNILLALAAVGAVLLNAMVDRLSRVIAHAFAWGARVDEAPRVVLPSRAELAPNLVTKSPARPSPGRSPEAGCVGERASRHAA